MGVRVSRQRGGYRRGPVSCARENFVLRSGEEEEETGTGTLGPATENIISTAGREAFAGLPAL